MFLDEVHEILQVAFGWTECYLHQFGSRPRHHGPETEYYLCPYQVEEGEPGVPEEEVRLDEVIADPGDTLCYLYDFGDNRGYVIRLEAVAPWDDTAPAAVCLDGRRDGPPEDCGGLGGYELISAAIDPLNPDHSDAVIEFERMYGIEFHAWTLAGGTPLSTLDADRAASDTRNVLRRLGGLTDDPHRYGAGSPNEDGVGFARIAVSSWPDADTPR